MKQPGTRAASQSVKERDLFRFRSIVFVTCGLEADQEVSLFHPSAKKLPIDCSGLQSNMVELVAPTQALGGHDVQVAVRNGLGITSPSERELFELNRDATLPDINSFLRGHMPQLFNHFAKADPWILTVNSSNWNDGDRLWPYVLLARRTNRTLVPALVNGRTDPTVSDLRENCGRKGGSPSDRVIFLGEIPSMSKHSCVLPLTMLDGSDSSRDNLQDSRKVDYNAVAKSRYVNFPTAALPITDNSFTENEPLSNSDDELSEVEILSPPRRRPVTRSVSAKRAVDEMEREGPLSSPTSLPPTKKAHREAAGNSTLLGSHLSQYVH